MAAIGHVSGPEMVRYPDPATEFPVVRLTDPAFASGMTAPHLHPFGRRSDFLVYWSERDGSRQAYRLDLKSNESKQLTAASALDASSLALTPDDRAVCFFDGPFLTETQLSNVHTRRLYQVPDGAVRAGMTVAADGSVLFAERADATARIVRVSKEHTGPVLTTGGDASLVMARPRRSEFVWREGDAVWLANLDGSGRRRLSLSPGKTGEMLWTPSGQTLVYLHVPDDSQQLITLREYSPDDNTDSLIAKTSQFAAVAPNGDASVFAGASRSKASSYVIILLRVTRRELTLCEHHASDPAMVSPVFPPDSQSVFFVSDRHGKSAIYRVHVEKFVEETAVG